ncbi:MAG: ATP-dependent zinc metalloprotease FtsH [bacterium]
MANDNGKPTPPKDPNGPKGSGPNREPDDKFEWGRALRTLTFWILLILVVIVISSYLSPGQQQQEMVDYSRYLTYLQNGQVESAVIIEKQLTGKLKTPDEKGRKEFKTILPFVNDDMVKSWDEKGVKVEFKERTANWIGMILTSILPWIIIIGLWIFFMRRMSAGANKGIFSFGKSKAKLLTENKPKVTFDDVAGGDEAKEELQEIIQFLKDPKKYQRLGGRIPKGGLLVGPPGTGKTLMARAVAGEAGVPFFSMSGADFVEMFVGVGASRVRDLFEQGKKNAPCIIFIDEIDAVGRQRGAGLGGGHDEREQTLNQLLVEMDGFESNEGVILIAATNRPDVLDPALLRPGRFDRLIVVDRPDVRGRGGILRVHSRKIPLAADVDMQILAKGTPGLSGADLANLVNEAALLAARRDADKVHMEDFENAKDKVMMGTERRSMLISDEEKKLTAYHEAGHVLVAKFTPGSDPVHKVTIIPRGQALGVTHYLPIDEKHSWAKKYIENKMIHLMGGRAAEMLVFDDYTNGAAADIRQATEIARRMVCDWGMSEKIGPLALSNRDHEVFLGRDLATQRDYSDATALEIDREMKRFIMKAQSTALDILKKNIDKLHILANALLEHEILDGEEIDLVLSGKTLPKPEEKLARVKKERARTETRESHKVAGGESGRLRQLEEVVSKLDQEKDGSSGRSEGRKRQPDSQKSKASGASTSGTGARRPPRRRRSGGGGSHGSGSGGQSGSSGGKS